MTYFGGMGPHVTQCRWAEAYLSIKWHLHPSSRWATTDMGRKLGKPPFWEELGPHLTQRGQVRGLPPCRVTP